jgi:hypothetical protein
MTFMPDTPKSKAKEIFVVDSYAKTPQQQEALTTAIDRLRSLDRDICIVSHLPVPESATMPGVKFSIFDKNNILGPNPTVLCWVIGDLEVRCPPPNYYHGPAVYTNLYNALRILAGGYERVHFVESDIGVDVISAHVDRAAHEFASRPEIQVVGYSFYEDYPARASTAILTSLISLKPQIVAHLPCISSWDDYMGLINGKRLILEEWFLDRLISQGIQYTLLPGSPVQDHSHAEGEYIIFKCRLRNSLYLVFVSNRSSRMLEARLKTNESIQVKPGGLAVMQNLSKDYEVLVRFIDSETVRHHPLKTMEIGAFKKADLDLCPDWDKMKITHEDQPN